MRHLLGELVGPGTWGVGGNLLANIVWTTPVTLLALWRHRRQVHARLDRIEAQIGQAPTDFPDQGEASP